MDKYPPVRPPPACVLRASRFTNLRPRLPPLRAINKGHSRLYFLSRKVWAADNRDIPEFRSISYAQARQSGTESRNFPVFRVRCGNSSAAGCFRKRTLFRIQNRHLWNDNCLYRQLDKPPNQPRSASYFETIRFVYSLGTTSERHRSAVIAPRGSLASPALCFGSESAVPTSATTLVYDNLSDRSVWRLSHFHRDFEATIVETLR